MGIAFLRMDRARVKWRYKLSAAFEQSRVKLLRQRTGQEIGEADTEGEGGKWALFILPFVTVLREGLEAVLFVSGVSADPYCEMCGSMGSMSSAGGEGLI